MLGRKIVGFVFLCSSTPLWAQLNPLPNDPAIYLAAEPIRMPMLIASADERGMNHANIESKKTEDAFEEPLFSKNKWHEYLGLGSLALAGLAVLAPKEDGKSPHHYLGVGAATLGGAAVASGLTFHYKDINWKHPLSDPDTLHALLGTLGALGYIMAVSEAPSDIHPVYGIMGAVSMTLAIKMEW